MSEDKQMLHPSLKEAKSATQGSTGCTSSSWRGLSHRYLLGDISGTFKEKKVSKSSQHELSKGKSCLTNLTAFMRK